MVIQHNIAALNSNRYLGINNSQTNSSLEKLSSGYKINRAADDAAGLAISEKMRGQISGLAMAEQNASQGINLIQTAEGALNETQSILQRMRELAVQSSNGTYQDTDREQITKEFEALKSEIDRISESTHYNNIKLLDGSLDSNNQVKVSSDLHSILNNVTLGGGMLSGEGLTVSVASYTNSTLTQMAEAGTKTTGAISVDTAIAVGDVISFDFMGTTVSTTVTEAIAVGEDSKLAQLMADAINQQAGSTDWNVSVNKDATTGDVALVFTSAEVGVNASEVALAGVGFDSNTITITGSGAASIADATIAVLNNAAITTGTSGTITNLAYAVTTGDTISFDISNTAGVLQSFSYTYTGATIAAGAGSTSALLTEVASQINSAGLGITATLNAAGDGLEFEGNETVMDGLSMTSISVTDSGGSAVGTTSLGTISTTTTVGTAYVEGKDEVWADPVLTLDISYVSSINRPGTLTDATGVSATYNKEANTFTYTDAYGNIITLNGDSVVQNGQAATITIDNGANLVFQIGANGGQDQRVSLSVSNMSTTSLGLTAATTKTDGVGAIDAEAAYLATAAVDTIDNANKAIEIIEAASTQVSGTRAELGALQNRMESSLNSLGVSKENLTAAESTIRDTNMAEEMTEFTKNNILVQAAQAMLAQANQLPQNVLSLLR